jgi:hypothetical protein
VSNELFRTIHSTTNLQFAEHNRAHVIVFVDENTSDGHLTQFRQITARGHFVQIFNEAFISVKRAQKRVYV